MSSENLAKESFYGLGTDLIDIRRIEAVLKQYKTRFLERIFTPAEIKLIEQKQFDCNFIAKRWAGKEAAIKAMSGKVSWHDIQITNDSSGKPIINISPTRSMISSKIIAYISLTDEYPYAQATVIVFQVNTSQT